MDSELRYKALHYAAKKFYAPIEMGLFLENDNLTVNIANETMHNFEGEIRFFVCGSDLKVKDSHTCKFTVDSLKSKDVFSTDVDMQNKYDEFV